MLGGMCKCQTCKAIFPQSWTRQGTHGACEVGVFRFCCGKCKNTFLAENTIPHGHSVDLNFKLELKKLQT
jgi:hypothetical protein